MGRERGLLPGEETGEGRREKKEIASGIATSPVTNRGPDRVRRSGSSDAPLSRVSRRLVVGIVPEALRWAEYFASRMDGEAPDVG